jgi:hypothetical protein
MKRGKSINKVKVVLDSKTITERELFLKLRELVSLYNITNLEEYGELRKEFEFLPEDPKEKFEQWFSVKEYSWCKSKDIIYAHKRKKKEKVISNVIKLKSELFKIATNQFLMK